MPGACRLDLDIYVAGLGVVPEELDQLEMRAVLLGQAVVLGMGDAGDVTLQGDHSDHAAVLGFAVVAARI